MGQHKNPVNTNQISSGISWRARKRRRGKREQEMQRDLQTSIRIWVQTLLNCNFWLRLEFLYDIILATWWCFCLEFNYSAIRSKIWQSGQLCRSLFTQVHQVNPNFLCILSFPFQCPHHSFSPETPNLLTPCLPHTHTQTHTHHLTPPALSSQKDWCAKVITLNMRSWVRKGAVGGFDKKVALERQH